MLATFCHTPSEHHTFLRPRATSYQGIFFYQGNISAIKMIKNGKDSCGSKSRHIHIRYFFTKDVLEREYMDVEHCATEDKIPDFDAKPLQGKQFYRLRNLIIGNTEYTVQEVDYFFAQISVQLRFLFRKKYPFFGFKQ